MMKNENKNLFFSNRTRKISMYIGLIIAFAFLFVSVASAQDPEFITVKLEQSTNQIDWYEIDGTLSIGYTMELDPSETYYYLNIKFAKTSEDLMEGFYGFNLTQFPGGYFSYWDNKGVNPSATPGSWQEHAWNMINGNTPIFYIHVDSNQNFELIDGLQRDWGGDDTALLRVNGDYPTGSYSFQGVVKAEDGTLSSPIDIDMDFVDEIDTIDEPVLMLLDLEYTTDVISWNDVLGSLYSGYSIPLNSSISYYRLDVRDFDVDKPLNPDYYGFFINSYPSGFFSYWATQGVDASSTPGTWQSHMWKIINGDAPRFYILVEETGGSQDIKLVDGLLKDFYEIDDAYFRINGDITLGMYSYTGTVTSSEGIDSDLIEIFFTFLDNSNYQVWVDDNYDSGTPGWGVTHFSSINNAINAVVSGGVIIVKPGTYKELVQVNKPVVMTSTFGSIASIISDEDSTYSDFLVTGGHTVQIASDHVYIDGLTIRRFESVLTTAAAVGNNGFPGLSHVEIRNCTVDSRIDGVFFSEIENVSFYSNDFFTQTDDIQFICNNSNDIVLLENNFVDYTLIGCKFDDCHDCNIYNNDISYKRIYSITIDNCQNIFIKKSIIRGAEDIGVYVNNSDGIALTDSSLIDNLYGVSLGTNAIVYLKANVYTENIRDINRAARIGNGDLYYSEIQRAINLSGINSEIFIYPGNFSENIIINKTVKLKKFADSLTEDIIITGGNLTPTLLIAPDNFVWNVEIDGLTLQGGNCTIRTGIYQNVNGLKIKNCIIKDPEYGYAIYIDPHNYSDIPPIRNGSNIFTTPITIDGNAVTGGMYFHFWPYEIYGVSVPRQLNVQYNDIDHVFLNGSISVRFYKNNIYTLGMMYSSDIIIEQNTFDNPWEERYAIYLWSINGTPPVKNVNIKQNTIIGYSSFAVPSGVSGQGIVVAGAVGISIESNDLKANTEGIWITRDYINRNGERCVGDVYDITIKSNKIENGQTGIKIDEYVNGTKIIGNNIKINGRGIFVHSSGYHLIANNTITGNYNGIRFDSGCENNLIYNNYFSENVINAYDQYSTTNVWNVSLRSGTNIMGGPYIGGNCWHDYLGEDTDGDSIGDTYIPHNSSGYIVNNGDYLPIKMSDLTPPYVNVIYPNGGEIINETITIRWVAYDDYDDDLLIDIEYSNNSGSTWHMIVPNQPNDGSYDWDTNGLSEGSNYLIRITATDNAGHFSNDTSAGTFTIYRDIPGPGIKIINPLLGYFYFFNNQKARFLSNNCFAIGHLIIQVEVITLLDVEKVEFYIDGQLVNTSLVPNGNVYSWEWDEIVLFYHEISVKAYDIHGSIGEDEIGVTIFNFNFIP